MYYIIEKIEEKYVICENSITKNRVNIKLENLPKDIKQGVVIKLKDGIYTIDNEKTEEIKQRIKEKIKRAWN